MFKVKLWLLRRWVFLALRCWAYYLWSRTYRRIYSGLAWDVRLPRIGTQKELEDLLKQMRWKKDGWRELWDAIDSPGSIWAKHKAGKEIGDCDEFAVIAAELMSAFEIGLPMYLLSGRYARILDLGILTVTWAWPGGSGGHNVCLFEYDTGDGPKWAHVGNWFGCEVQWRFASEREAIRNVLELARLTPGRSQLRPLGAAFADRGLRLIRYWSGRELERP